MISAVPPAQVSALKADTSLVLKEFGSWAVDLLFFNEKVPQYKDRHVRRAIAHAINIPQLAKVTTFGTAKPGNSFFPPSLQYYAKRPDSWLQRSPPPRPSSDSPPIRTGSRPRSSCRAATPSTSDAATVIQSELKALNIDVSIQRARQRRLHSGLRGLQLRGDDQLRHQRHK